MNKIKCVFIGNNDSMKTAALFSIIRQVPDIPLLFDNYSPIHEIPGYPPVTIQLWDTAGQEDLSEIRKLPYAGTDVFVLCFSLVSTSSLENIKMTWIPEIREFCPESPIILLGTKSELRDRFDYLDDTLKKPGMRPIQTQEGKDVAIQINAQKYIEISTAVGMKNHHLLDEITRTYYEFQNNKKKVKHSFFYHWVHQ